MYKECVHVRISFLSFWVYHQYSPHLERERESITGSSKQCTKKIVEIKVGWCKSICNLKR